MKNENEVITYWESVYTGQVYKLYDKEPRFGGYIQVDRQAYEDWMKKHGLEP